MKILHIINSLNRGGAEMMLYQLLSHLDRSECELSVVSLMGDEGLGEDIRALGIPVYSVGMRRIGPSPVALMRARKLLRSIEADIIHGWLYYGSLAASLGRQWGLTKARVLWSIHHGLSDLQGDKWRTRRAIARLAKMSGKPSRIVYCSMTSAEQHEAARFSSENRVVIPNGFDCEKFHFSEKARREIRQELGIGNDKLVVGHLGRWHPVKNQVMFLEAAAMLLERKKEVSFVMAGIGVDPANPAIKEMISDHPQLEGRVHLLGERCDISRLLSGMDILALSSLAESFPLVVGEAMACAVPCVVTDVGDCARIVGASGVVVPSGDTLAFLNGMEALLDIPEEERKSAGESARARIIEKFGLTKVVGNFEKLYMDVLTEGGDA